MLEGFAVPGRGERTDLVADPTRVLLASAGGVEIFDAQSWDRMSVVADGDISEHRVLVDGDSAAVYFGRTVRPIVPYAPPD